MPVVLKTGPIHEGQGETGRKGLQMVGGRFDKQENLHSRLAFGTARQQIPTPTR